MGDAYPLLKTFTASLLILTGVARPATAQIPVSQNRSVRQLSVDDAVRLAIEQNLGLEAERLNPQIQDTTIAEVRALNAPTLTSAFTNNRTSTPSTNLFSGGETKVTDSRFSTELGLAQRLRSGGNYTFAWDSSRSTSTNFFSNFDPLLNANIRFAFTQPLLRDFKIDTVRHQLALSERDRAAADVQLRRAIVLTTRAVKNAYWDLISQIDALKAAQQSLDLSRQQLSDNERRVKVGTMAPIDIVEAQSEVARNEEAVIVAEAAIQDAEDQLRAVIFRPDTPDFWSMSIQPSDVAPFRSQAIDLDAAVRRAMGERIDLKLAKNQLEQIDINVRFLSNQTLPDVRAAATYGATAAGGSLLTPLTEIPLGETVTRTVLAQRGFGSVLGDLLTSAFPTWRVGMTFSYPIGTSSDEAALARTRLHLTQRQTELKNLELQAAVEVRSVGRQVQTNQKRVESTRVARELAERRLEAAQKKFAAGVETQFFVFQAQRDLAQARTNEVRAISDYNRSLVDFEAVQEVSLTGPALPSSAAVSTLRRATAGSVVVEP
jgi:outer membrane protein TolC